jgi:hypothetical protein
LTLKATKKPVATSTAALGSTASMRVAIDDMPSVPVTW